MHRQELDVTALEAHLAGFGALAPLIFIAAFAVGAVLILPGVIFTLAGGALFGPFFGLAFNLTGATIGATIAFLISRHLGADWVEHKSGPRLKRLMEGVDAEGWRFVAFTRLVPLFPFNLLNYALGLTGIRTLPYVVTTAICMIPGGLAYTYLGYAGREALAGGESAVQNALLAIGLLVAVAFLPRLVRAFRKPNSISVGDLASRLKSEDAITVLDVRGADDFTGELGHVPGALNMPLAGLSEHLDALKAKAGGTVAVICLTDKRSRAAISLLEKQGFTDLLLVDGGMKEWNRLGFAVNREGNAGNKGTAKESSL
ncbi:MAG: VTT domain-containing protein [Rhodospirillales bacterium]|nr:VTT domain-containing protein [Rhodospirillales bacterium]